MSMIPQQQHSPSPSSSLHWKGPSWLKAEWDHLLEIPMQRLWFLLLPTLLLSILNPLLPLVAYAMQRWAGSSWTWHDRWASVWTWARQGVLLVAILLSIAWLAHVHILFFPALVGGLQNAWRTAHLPDDLSLALTPLNRYALATRTLLFLPLAPALSLYYEWIDPRTPMQLQRVLTPHDIAAPPPPIPVSAPPSTPAKAKKRSASLKAKRTTATTQQRGQMTIESVLSPQQEQSTQQFTPGNVITQETPLTPSVTMQDTHPKPPNQNLDWTKVAD